MSTVSESQPAWAMVSAEKMLGMASQPIYRGGAPFPQGLDPVLAHRSNSSAKLVPGQHIRWLARLASD